MEAKYSLIIRWSEQDQCFVAWVPEFGPAALVHGDTYEAAAKAAREVIESYLDIPVNERPATAVPWSYEGPQKDTQIGEALFPGSDLYQPPRKKSAVA
jgi:antitoxin HicB